MRKYRYLSVLAVACLGLIFAGCGSGIVGEIPKNSLNIMVEREISFGPSARTYFIAQGYTVNKAFRALELKCPCIILDDAPLIPSRLVAQIREGIVALQLPSGATYNIKVSRTVDGYTLKEKYSIPNDSETHR